MADQRGQLAQRCAELDAELASGDAPITELQGKLVLEFTIAPSGEITMCRVVSSELNDPDLERKIIARVRLFHFDAKDVETITTTKPIDFFPA